MPTSSPRVLAIDRECSSMSTLSSPVLKKLLLFVPALGCFGPILMVMGLTGAPSSFHVLALLGALSTGVAVAIVGAVLSRLLGDSSASSAPVRHDL